MAERDVMLFKEANCNYVRTSHYPPSECFLELCDRHGIYVEDELPHAFIARTLDYTQRDPAQTQRYLQSFADLYARDANHPSVLIWSLCNESFGGYNFDVLNRFVRATDPTRPTKFSYPMTMQAEHEPVDIWSIHYTNLDGDLGARLDNVSVPGAYGHDMPVLHDECVHVPCYNRGEHRRDPNVRAFWGESIKAFWDLAWETEGALGGAIWAGIDETDMNWGGRGRHEWGIIDAWRRRKPEHYMTRKAYSPVAVRNVENEPGGIRVTIENRYCHTDLCETWVEWRAEGEGGRLRLPEAAPRMSAPFLVPLRMPLRAGARLRLDFYDASGNHVDEYVHELPACDALPGGLEPFAPPAALAAQTPPSVAMAANGGARIVSCGCEYLFSGETGLIEEARVNGEPILVGGPVMNMPYYSLGEWRCKDFRAEPNGNFAHVTIRGEYAEACDVTFQLSIEPGGILRTRYTIGALKRNLPRMEKLRVGVDCGGLDELGVYYAVVPAADTLRWKRRGAWSVYPDDHIARNEGMAPRYAEPAAFGREPLLPWALDTKNYTLNGLYDPGYLGTNDFRSQKTEIMSAELYSEDGSACVAVMSDGSHSVRLETEEPAALLVAADDPRVRYCGAWYKSEDPRGGRFGAERLARERGACAELAFCGVGCVWYGPVDIHYGCARVWVDGALADSRIDARVDGVEFLGSAPGSDKKHGFPLFCVSGLTAGEHLLRIEVLGEHSAQSVDDYIAISHFRILDGTREAVRLIVNNAYNYPHIAWGCRSRPAIMPSDGFTACAEMRLLTRPNRQPQPGAYTRERKHLPIQAK
jgi:hypothetical protein